MKNGKMIIKIILFGILIVFQGLIIMNLRDNNNELNYLSYWVLVIISGFVSSFIILLLSFGSLSLKEFFINNLSLTKNESNSLIYLLNGLLIILYIVYVLAEV